MKSYTDLILLPTFKERFEYLKLSGSVGEDTFGFDRYLNQKFYRTSEWRKVRDAVIIRDNGCDLGVEGYEIYDRIVIHHINPITAKDIEKHADWIIDPNQLICTSFKTHNAIHYGNIDLVDKQPTIRELNDTCPWKR